MYALDEVTITLEPTFASTDEAVINGTNSSDVLAYEQDPMIAPLAFEQDILMENTQEISYTHQHFRQILKRQYLFISIFEKSIKHSSEQFSSVNMICLKHILTDYKDQ